MKQKNRAVFLDRDGTVNVEKDYLYRQEDFELLPGVIEGLKKFQGMGYLLIIVTNQSGIARNYYSEEDYYKLTEWMKGMFEQKGIHLSAVYHCPHHPQGTVAAYTKECDCRKPGIGLYERARKDFALVMEESIAIGDKERDVAVCAHYHMAGFLIYQNAQEIDCKGVSKLQGGILEAAEMLQERI